MPRLIRPMLASLCHYLPRDDDRYGWEFKWDGGPCDQLPRRRHPPNALPQRQGHHRQLPRPGRLPGRVILDGEIVAVSDGRRDFEVLRWRDRRADLGLDQDPVRIPPWYPGGRGTSGRQLDPRPGRHRRQAAGLGLLSGAAAGLDQGQERPAPSGHHLRLDTRTGPPGRHHRVPAARGLRQRAPALHRARRWKSSRIKVTLPWPSSSLTRRGRTTSKRGAAPPPPQIATGRGVRSDIRPEDAPQAERRPR